MANTRPKDHEGYFKLTLPQVELAKQEIDAAIEALRAEKVVANTVMDRLVHAEAAKARISEMSDAERIALRQVLTA